MKLFFKVLVVSFLYRCEIEKAYYSSLRKETRWRFKLYPRKVQMFIVALLFVPVIFVIHGYKGVIEGWSDCFEMQSWSSYEIWGKTKPSKHECYALF